jgi:membrane protein DedA with SNARE-associated domain
MEGAVLRWAAGAVGVLGYGGVALLMLLEDIILPIPSEVIMPAAGFLSARYGLSLWGMIAAGTLGSTVGSLPWYYVGRALGRRRFPVALAKLRAGVSRTALQTAERWFTRHGNLAVFLARLLPGVRPLIGIPAGLTGMRLAPFLFYSAAGTLIWVSALAVAGRLMGTELMQVTGLTPWFLAGVAVVAAAWWLVRRVTRHVASPGRLPRP